jgi:hypothetical protein
VSIDVLSIYKQCLDYSALSSKVLAFTALAFSPYYRPHLFMPPLRVRNKKTTTIVGVIAKASTPNHDSKYDIKFVFCNILYSQLSCSMCSIWIYFCTWLIRSRRRNKYSYYVYFHLTKTKLICQKDSTGREPTCAYVLCDSSTSLLCIYLT